MLADTKHTNAHQSISEPKVNLLLHWIWLTYSLCLVHKSAKLGSEAWFGQNIGMKRNPKEKQAALRTTTKTCHHLTADYVWIQKVNISVLAVTSYGRGVYVQKTPSLCSSELKMRENLRKAKTAIFHMDSLEI